MRKTCYIHKISFVPKSKALHILSLIIIFNLQFSIFNSVSAQTFLDDLKRDVPGQGKVTVTQSKEIDELVNGRPAQAPQAPQAQPNAQKTETQKNDTPTPSHDGKETAKTEEDKPDSTKRQPIVTEDEDETVPPDMRKKVMRRSYKMQGFRVQVYSGGNSRADRQRAETAGAVMKSHFPDQPIYTHFYSPSWKCRMGNYKTQAEAQAYLAKVRKLGYRQACIVKGPIQVQY